MFTWLYYSNGAFFSLFGAFFLFSINFSCSQCFDVCNFFSLIIPLPSLLSHSFSIILFDAGFAQLLSHHVCEHIFYHSFRPADCFSPLLSIFLPVSSSVFVSLFLLPFPLSICYFQILLLSFSLAPVSIGPFHSTIRLYSPRALFQFSVFTVL